MSRVLLVWPDTNQNLQYYFHIRIISMKFSFKIFKTNILMVNLLYVNYTKKSCCFCQKIFFSFFNIDLEEYNAHSSRLTRFRLIFQTSFIFPKKIWSNKNIPNIVSSKFKIFLHIIIEKFTIVKCLKNIQWLL